MANDLRSFLDWFEGFSENLEKPPNAKQWDRIRTRILALKSSPDVDAPVQQPKKAEPMQPVKRKPANIDEWRYDFIQACVELGADDETAREFLAEYPEPDLSLDPSNEARKAIGPFLN